MQGLISQPEAERMIEGLQAFQLRDVGTPRWFTQHDIISRLNLQVGAAYLRSPSHADE